MQNKVILHYDPAQSLRCINYVLSIIGTGKWQEDVAKSFLLEAQAHLTQRAEDNFPIPCVECGEIEFDKDLYCLHCGRRNYRESLAKIREIVGDVYNDVDDVTGYVNALRSGNDYAQQGTTDGELSLPIVIQRKS